MYTCIHIYTYTYTYIHIFNPLKPSPLNTPNSPVSLRSLATFAKTSSSSLYLYHRNERRQNGPQTLYLSIEL